MNPLAKKSYFGIVSLIAAMLSVLFLGVNYGVSQLNITPQAFSSLNNVTALIACSLAPLTVLFGVIGFIKKRDSKLFSGMALVLVGAPFLVLFTQMIFSIARSN